MAILKIARMGHPVLRQAAAPVGDPRAPEIARLVADMIETMQDAPGVGLAAPQVHAPLRIVVFHVPAARAEPTHAPVPITVLINPVIVPLDEERDAAWEACLSVPGLTGLVPRYRRIRYTGLTPDNKMLDRVAEGFHARVVQHECDHLDGVLYPARVQDPRHFGFAEEIRRYPLTTSEGQPQPQEQEGEGRS